MKKSPYGFVLWLIAFVTYNVLVFISFGFADHAAPFWISYAFAILAFFVVIASVLLLGKVGFKVKDWLFGFPIVKHCIFYSCIELAASVAFMITDDLLDYRIALVAHFLILAVYLMFLTSCLMAKESIEKVHENVKAKTQFIGLLRAEAEMLVADCTDAESKKVFSALAEKIRYSDPMSNDEVAKIEDELFSSVSLARTAIRENDTEKAKELCAQAESLLAERNLKIKALK